MDNVNHFSAAKALHEMNLKTNANRFRRSPFVPGNPVIDHFSLNDVLNIVAPGYQKTVANATSAAQKASDAAAWIADNWKKVLVMYFVALVLAGVIANKING